jgi:hypothetical protein
MAYDQRKNPEVRYDNIRGRCSGTLAMINSSRMSPYLSETQLRERFKKRRQEDERVALWSADSPNLL